MVIVLPTKRTTELSFHDLSVLRAPRYSPVLVLALLVIRILLTLVIQLLALVLVVFLGLLVLGIAVLNSGKECKLAAVCSGGQAKGRLHTS